MKIGAVNSTNTSKGKKIGTAAGAAAGGAYVLKNRADIFEKGVNEGIKQLESAGKTIGKNKAIAVAGAVSAASIAVVAVAGRIIGGVIGKLVDKHNEKKQMEAVKQLIAESVNKTLETGDIKTYKIEELKKVTKE